MLWEKIRFFIKLNTYLLDVLAISFLGILESCLVHLSIYRENNLS